MWSYFLGGKFHEKVGKNFHMGENFQDISPISLIKSFGFYFPMGEILAKKVMSQKNPKIIPTQKFPRLQYNNICGIEVALS